MCMKDRLSTFGKHATRIFFVAAVCGLSWACADEYKLDDEKPSWLNSSIYETLQSRGNFQYYLQLLGDSAVNPTSARPLTEVLSRTGSKTLFVANDEAWEKFFQNNKNLPESNPWHNATSYANLTQAQKKLLIHSSMLNNAIVMENLASSDGSGSNPPTRGEYMRRYTDVVLTDSVMRLSAEEIPMSYNETDMSINYWKEALGDNDHMYLVTDSTLSMMLHFTSEHMSKQTVLNSDFDIFMNLKHKGETRADKDVYIYDSKLVEKDAVAENGYVNVTDKVITPLPNMAEMLRTSGRTKIFSHMLDRFSFPYKNDAVTEAYKTLHPEFDEVIYTKKYFAQIGARHASVLYGPDGEKFQDENGEAALKFDPGWNGYYDEVDLRKDMAAMFVPDDETLWTYFRKGGGGMDLIKTYAANPDEDIADGDYETLFRKIDAIPLSTLQAMINVIMFRSFVGSVPSKMNKLRDDAQDEMFTTDDIQEIDTCLVACNGIVYLTKKVYGSANFTSVAAPAYISKTNLILKWAIYNGEVESQDQMKLNYYAYLKAMRSKFAFFLPSDAAMKRYYDPVSFTSQKPRVLALTYTGKGAFPLSKVLYRYDVQTATKSTAYNNENISNDEIINRLKDILESHTIVMDGTNPIDSEDQYYITKNGSAVKVTRDNDNNIIGVQGGYQLENERKGIVDGDSGTWKVEVKPENRIEKKNGMTFVLDDAPIIPACTSVYGIINTSADTNGDFSEFYAQCVPNTEIIQRCGLVDASLSTEYRTRALKKYQPFIDDKGVDFNVQFFNNYRYTVFIPTNEAILREADEKGLPTWEKIEEYYENLPEDEDGDRILTHEDSTTLQAMIVYLNNFVRAHFLDNSVFVDKSATAESDYVTSSYDSELGVFVKVHAQRVQENGTTHLYVRDDNGGDRYMVTDDPMYQNIMTRDISCNIAPTGRNTMNSITISGSSFAVLHQINGVLYHTPLVNGRHDSNWATPQAAAKYLKSHAIPEPERFSSMKAALQY